MSVPVRVLIPKLNDICRPKFCRPSQQLSFGSHRRLRPMRSSSRKTKVPLITTTSRSRIQKHRRRSVFGKRSNRLESKKSVNHLIQEEMSNPNTSVQASPLDYFRQYPSQVAASSTNPSQGPVAIFWDIENCPVPSDVRPEDVAVNIRMALQVHPSIKGVVTSFSAFGDFNAFPRRLREGCQRTGVKLVDVPNGRKDAADRAILADMFVFALDNRPPSSIMLISGDVDFAPALHILGQRGYTIILVIPSCVGVSSALINAGRYVWDWSSMVRAEGFVPSHKALLPPSADPGEIVGPPMGRQINGDVDCEIEEESIVFQGIARRAFSMPPQSRPEYRSNLMPMLQNAETLSPSSFPGRNNLTWVQPGDLTGLKTQFVKLLEMLGGSAPLMRLPAEYQKLYGRTLYVSEFGAAKLVNLLRKMADAIVVDGKGHRRIVWLRRLKSPSVCPTMILTREKKEKGNQAKDDSMAGVVSSDELSDEERLATVECDDRMGEVKSSPKVEVCSEIINLNLRKFKYELEETMVSYSCRIFLSSFEAIYLLRYKQQLDYQLFGVNDLEELLEKMTDIVELQEEPGSRRKFITLIGG